MMKRGLFSAALIVVFFCLVSFAEGSEQEQEQTFRVSVPAANIRFEPNTTSSVISRVERGTVLKVIGRERDWIKVSLPTEGGLEKIGYILGRLGNLETVQKLSALPVQAREEPAPAKEKPEASVSPKVQNPAPVSQTVARPQQKSGPGRFGVGLNLAAAPGGAAPSILYDLTDRVTLNAALGLYSGVTGMTGELLYRFPQPAKSPPSDVAFEPYLGGGVILVFVRSPFRVGQGTYTGFVGSGGTFLTIKKIPRWRFNGDINIVQFNIEGIAVAGVGIGLGFHYFF